MKRVFAILLAVISVLAVCVSCGKQGSDERKGGNGYAFVFDVKYVGGSNIWTEEKALVELDDWKNTLSEYADLVNRYNRGSESEENTMKTMGHKCALLFAEMECFEGTISLKRGSEILGSWDVGAR